MILTTLLASLALAPPQTDASEEAASTFDGLEFRSIGPALMSGRISDIAVHPDDQSTWIVGVGSGGVWKTTNAGTTWTPVFDDQPSYSIGCVEIDPSQPSTIWVGTGENVSGRHVGYGDGIYRSTDGGATWEARGLAASEHIGSIVIHPDDSDVLLVAAQGPLWSGGGERGVYRTEDGGATWTQVLAAGPYTGANEVVMDPNDPDVLYAAMHQRLRTVAALMNGGPESGIFKSTDGGVSWAKLEGGLPTGHVGKIGLAVSPFDSDLVYATIEEGDRDGGFWRSTDGGGSWEKRSDYLSGGTGPHYYQEIFASPHQPGTVYQMDVRLHVTDDGGLNFRRLGYDAKHSDNHALAFDPNDPDYLLVGCDGGIYETWDHGETWKFCANLPVTQFYKVALDDSEPFYMVYGGTQDNNTQCGPSRTLDANGIRNADWLITLFGDGHQPATEPGNPGIAYSEWQEGNLCRYDATTGEIVYIKPQPAEGEPQERFNWDSPILVSRHDPARIYFASQRVWRSDDRGDDWRPVSGDLTRDIDRLREPIMGQTWGEDAAWDLDAMSRFSTITSLAESPVDQNVLWAGTDDGRVQVTSDGGASWTAIDALPGIPDRFFVNDVKADRFDAKAAYVVVDDHKTGDFSPYVLKTDDLGKSWSLIVEGIPERSLCWRIVQDHVDPALLFLGTEFGPYVSRNGGAHWDELSGGMPRIPVRDLAIQEREDDLVCATFGRGFYVLDDISPLREVSDEALAQDVALLGARDALWYVPRRPLGGASPLGRGSQGDAYFVAANPPFGAVFTYHLAEDLLSTRESRRAADEENGQAVYPAFEALIAEDEEPAPAILLTVEAADGTVVRRLQGPAKKGFHRVAWDLRRPSVDAWERSAAAEEWDDGSGDGALAPPGTYTVRIAKRVGGEVKDLGQSRTFEVVPLGGGALEGATPAEVAAFQTQLAAVQRAASAARARAAELVERADAIVLVLGRTPSATPDHEARARRAASDVRAIQRRLDGDPRRQSKNDAGPVAVSDRLSFVGLGVRYSTYGPTEQHRRSLQIAATAIAEIDAALREVEANELDVIRAELERLGA
ncbi:MAG: glycosyl hydrolase, partial [Planctomycetota bacterium]